MTPPLRSAWSYIYHALREPEDFIAAWDSGEKHYPWWVWIGLIVTAIIGTATYGMTMGLLGGVERVVQAGLICTIAAGVAWGVSLPALYIFNSMSGSKLSISSTFLAAIVTTSWGGLAMLASIPINWFFTVAVPHPALILVVNLIVFAGVGLSMSDVFGRIMQRLEPTRGRVPVIWLMLVAALGAELFYSFGLFNFTIS